MRLEEINDNAPLPVAITEKGLKYMIEYSLDYYENLSDRNDTQNEQRADVLSFEEIQKAIEHSDRTYGTDVFVYQNRLNTILNQGD